MAALSRAAAPLLAGRIDPGSALVPLVAAGIAFLVGAMLAASVPIGLGLTVAVIYAVIAFVSLPAAMALWVPLLLLQFVPGVEAVWMPALGVIVVAAVGAPGARRSLGALVAENRRLIAFIVLLLVWMFVSVARTEKPDLTFSYVQLWLIAATLFALIGSSVSRTDHARAVVAAFVGGALISVLLGFAGAPLNFMNPESAEANRLSGGAGDPNVLAAGLVPAIVLAAALGAGVRDALGRLGIVVVIVVLGAGLAATESRGGLIAAAVAVAMAFVVFKRHRAQALVVIALLMGATAMFFAAAPDAMERITSFDASGTGRSDLWRVALRMSGDHPVAGVGLGNFTVHSGEYVREPGRLTSVDLIVDRAQVAHNVYLQQLAESGIVGLVLFLGVALSSLAAALSAARRFERAGDVASGTLARGVAVSLVALLAASTFLTNGFSLTTWLLFALGPVLLALSSALESGSSARTSRTR